MKHSKSLLSEYWDSHEKQFSVLIVTDDASLERSGFFRHIISKRLMVGEIVSIDKGTSADIRNKVVAEANPELDVIIVFLRGIYDKNPADVIRNLISIQYYGDTIDTPIITFSIPTLRFISDKKNISQKWSEQIRKKINDILITEFGAIDISDTDRDEYFKNDGQTLSLLAHKKLYSLLRNKVKMYNVDMPSLSKDNDNFKLMLNKVQIKLLDLGYKIKKSEISNKIYGSTTKTAVRDIIKLLGYPPIEQLTKSIAKAILLLDELPSGQIDVDTQEDISMAPCDNPIHPGARRQYDPAVYTGTNGIASNFNLKTVNGTTLESEAADQFLKMMTMMQSANIVPAGTPEGWRTYETQYNIVDWDLYECTGIWRKLGSNGEVKVAEPGKSNHGSGRAIDVSGVEAQEWIKENGPNFGWYHGEVPEENWHFTFNLHGKWYGGEDGEEDGDEDGDEEEKGILDKGFDMAKKLVPQLKIFDHKNPKHVGILREELKRARRIIQEYSDNDQNNNGYPDDTESSSSQLTKQQIESVLIDHANFEFDIYQKYGNPKNFFSRRRNKQLIHPSSTENEIYLDLNDVRQSDTFFEYIEPVKNYLQSAGGRVQLDKYNFVLNGNTIIISISNTSQLTKQELESIDRDAWTYIRGILKMINDPERYRNTDELKQFVAQKVGASTTNDEELKHKLIRYALNGVEAMMKLNIAVQRILKRINPINPINFSSSMPDDKLPDSLRVRPTPWGDYSGD